MRIYSNACCNVVSHWKHWQEQWAASNKQRPRQGCPHEEKQSKCHSKTDGHFKNRFSFNHNSTTTKQLQNNAWNTWKLCNYSWTYGNLWLVKCTCKSPVFTIRHYNTMQSPRLFTSPFTNSPLQPNNHQETFTVHCFAEYKSSLWLNNTDPQRHLYSSSLKPFRRFSVVYSIMNGSLWERSTDILKGPQQVSHSSRSVEPSHKVWLQYVVRNGYDIVAWFCK